MTTPEKTTLTLEAKRTAVVLIDLQQWILGMPVAPHATADLVANAVRLCKAVAAGGGTIVKVRVAFSSSYADALQRPVDEPMPRPAGGIPEAGLAFHPDIEAVAADVLITKRQWSAFYGSELDLQLRRRGIDTVVIGGVATNFGVESTARDAWQNNYAVVIAEDASSSREEAMHRFAIERILPRVARVRSTSEIVRALGGA